MFRIITYLLLSSLTLVASAIEIRPTKAQMSEAQIMGGLYGVLIGHLDGCGLTVQRWHVEAMGRQITNLASNDDDRELAIGMIRSMSRTLRRADSMLITAASIPSIMRIRRLSQSTLMGGLIDIERTGLSYDCKALQKTR